eukprot:jgi/Mesen1/1493/ME000132S00438
MSSMARRKQRSQAAAAAPSQSKGDGVADQGPEHEPGNGPGFENEVPQPGGGGAGELVAGGSVLATGVMPDVPPRKGRKRTTELVASQGGDGTKKGRGRATAKTEMSPADIVALVRSRFREDRLSSCTAKPADEGSTHIPGSSWVVEKDSSSVSKEEGEQAAAGLVPAAKRTRSGASRSSKDVPGGTQLEMAEVTPESTEEHPGEEERKASKKIVSWNVNGLRALLKGKGQVAAAAGEVEAHLLHVLAQREDPDVICLQETKLQEAPLAVQYGLGRREHDEEGRVIAAEFPDFFLVNTYVPNSGDGLRRLAYRQNEWDPALASYIKDLERSKPVVLTGDLNCARDSIDIWNPAGNKRSAGFTDEERESFSRLLLGQGQGQEQEQKEGGLVDTFRHQHPAAVAYTYWGYRLGARKKNRGWRLDYFLVSSSLSARVHDSYTMPDVGGSDHCPIGLIFRLPVS